MVMALGLPWPQGLRLQRPAQVLWREALPALVRALARALSQHLASHPHRRRLHPPPRIPQAPALNALRPWPRPRVYLPR